MLSLFVSGAYAGNVVRVSDVDVDRYPELSIVVSVTDKATQASVVGLAAGDFAVSVDGKPAVISRSESTLKQAERVAVAILIDTSGSMRGGPLDAAKAAAVDMMGRLSASDSACVIGFGKREMLQWGFTSDRAAFKSTLSMMTSHGNTALYDAVIWAAKNLSTQKAERKAVVLLTDGVDTKSASSYDLCAKTVADLGVAVYAVGLGRNVAHDKLAHLAEVSGGRYCRAVSSSDLQAIYQSIAQDLRNRYTISFAAPIAMRNGSWHDLVVAAGGAESKKRFMAALGPRGAYGGGQGFSGQTGWVGGIALLGLANASAISAYFIKRRRRNRRLRRL